jgi:hypothetical protein
MILRCGWCTCAAIVSAVERVLFLKGREGRRGRGENKSRSKTRSRAVTTKVLIQVNIFSAKKLLLGNGLFLIKVLWISVCAAGPSLRQARQKSKGGSEKEEMEGLKERKRGFAWFTTEVCDYIFIVTKSK